MEHCGEELEWGPGAARLFPGRAAELEEQPAVVGRARGRALELSEAPGRAWVLVPQEVVQTGSAQALGTS